MSGPECRSTHVAGLPHLDADTLSEEWALTQSLGLHWQLLARSLGVQPSDWRDSTGERVYAAVLWLTFRIDPQAPMVEDDRFVMRTRLAAIRKPYALSRTRIGWGRGTGAEVGLLTGFVRRHQHGTNKKFATVRDIWTDRDHHAHHVETLLDRHHAARSAPLPQGPAGRHRVNRLVDFNAAGLFYFRNFVRLARMAEGAVSSAPPVQREAWFFGNADHAQQLDLHLQPRDEGLDTAVLAEDGRCLFRSHAQA
ncbi:MAG: LnmK family bifunctional acyltransferase/decarboxylase [Gemmobacter sp.]